LRLPICQTQYSRRDAPRQVLISPLHVNLICKGIQESVEVSKIEEIPL